MYIHVRSNCHFQLKEASSHFLFSSSRFTLFVFCFVAGVIFKQGHPKVIWDKYVIAREFLTAMLMKKVIPWSPLKVYWCFRGMYCPHL
jgi:hypothetical protein